MANTDGPFGLRWVGSLQSSTKSPPVIAVSLPAAVICGVGSVIAINTNATAGVPALCGDTGLGADNLVLGIAAGYKAQTTAAETIPLIRPHDQIFEIQAEEGTTWEDIDTVAEILEETALGTTFGFAGGATISAANVSGMYLDVGTTGGAVIDTIFELVGTYSTRPDNTIASQYANIHVRITPDSIAAGTTSQTG